MRLENKNFETGLVTRVEDQTVKRGGFTGGLNWIIKGDRVELRQGYSLVGTHIDGVGKVNGLGVGLENDNSEVLFRARGTKLEYSTDGDTYTEIGSDILYNENTSIIPFNSICGNYVIISSPNLAHIYAVNTEAPDNYVDILEETTALGKAGWFNIVDQSMFQFGRLNDSTTPYRSHKYAGTSTLVSAESVDTGDGGKTYSGTLAFKSGNARAFCFAVTFDTADAANTEVFNDNRDGTLTGDAGGTGTINYATGAFTLAFFAVVALAEDITSTYSWHDMAVDGITDFSSTATRVANEGISFRQPVGGDIHAMVSYRGVVYAFHETSIYSIETTDDVSFQNKIFRENFGCSSWGGIKSTGDGIYFINNSISSQPFLAKLSFENISGEVLPENLSSKLDLSNYDYSKAKVWEHGDRILFTGYNSLSDENNRMFVLDKVWNAWFAPQDLFVNAFADFGSALIVGDSITNNTWKLDDGFADYNSSISNTLLFTDDNLDADRLKRLHYLNVDGYIAKAQNVKVFARLDCGDRVELGTIEGDADYVQAGNSKSIGGSMIGSNPIGGRTSSVDVYCYNARFNVTSLIGKFERIQLEFEAQDVGHIEITRIDFNDFRLKEQKQPYKYRKQPIK